MGQVSVITVNSAIGVSGIKNIGQRGPDFHDFNHIGKTRDHLQKVIRILEKSQTPEYLNLVKVKIGNEIRFVPVAELIFFKAEDKYTVAMTVDTEYLIKTPIKDLEKRLDPDLFRRVHRSAIVNVEKIKVIKRPFTNQMVIGFEDIDQTIPVSRAYEQLFRQM